MEIDESHEYFKLVLPESIKGKLLQITTKQNKEEEIKEDEPFSDPDVYVSKINKYPSSKRSAEWYSEQYGSDILTIPAESVEEDVMSLQVFPNPFTSVVSISTEKTAQNVSIYDLNGRLVMSQGITGTQFELNLSALTPGAYLLQIDYGSSRSVHRIMKAE